MYRTLTPFLVLGVAVVGRADEEDSKRLEGVWASKPPANGRGRGNVFYIRGGLLGWDSYESKDGEAVIGHAKLYRFEIDPKAKPKSITLTLGKGKDTETRLGIYELDGDTLKVAFAGGKEERPKAFDDAIVFTRDKKAKMPKLDDEDEDEPIEIKSRSHWAGQVKDSDLEKQCPKGPIASKPEFEKVWKVLRDKEAIPAVDFAKEFVQIRTMKPGFKLKDFWFILKTNGKTDEVVSVESGVKYEGFTYVIAVFPRDLIDVVDGKLVGKKKGK